MFMAIIVVIVVALSGLRIAQEYQRGVAPCIRVETGTKLSVWRCPKISG
jgi:regulator of protease activity HflC (stomatin/prohibitin superfamily)